eukprot:scaffold24938_cov25-Cyclotella_meneghiniana.AAC.1
MDTSMAWSVQSYHRCNGRRLPRPKCRTQRKAANFRVANEEDFLCTSQVTIGVEIITLLKVDTFWSCLPCDGVLRSSNLSPY